MKLLIVDDRHEIRFKLENVGLSAQGKRKFDTKLNGEIQLSDEQVNDFSLTELALQLRCRYQLRNTSNIFLVYSRGGESEIDSLD